jgi:predicted ATPase
LRLPYFWALLAEAWGAAGRPGEALQALDEAMAEARATHERVWDAELHRLRGVLRLEAGAAKEEAEAAVVRSLEIARGMEARAFELRAATSLASITGRSGPLTEVLRRTEEREQTPDLCAARALLSRLTPD